MHGRSQRCLRANAEVLTPPQSILDKSSKDKADIIAERQANLPLPDDPPGPSDFNSADARNVNISSSDVATGDLSTSDGALREPATGDSAFRADADDLKTNVQGARAGREGADNLGGLPNDAVSQGKKNTQGLADTTNQGSAADRAAGQ